MFFTLAFSVDEDVIKVYYQENVKLLCQDHVNITLERGRCIGQSKKHNLILEIAIAGLKGQFLFVSFLNCHSMISISQN